MRCLLAVTTCLAGACDAPPVPPPAQPDVTSMRLSITMPTAFTELDVGSAPGCATVAAGIQLPLGADVTFLAEFLNDAGESDPVVHANAAYRVSGDGVPDPSPAGGIVTFSRMSGFLFTLHGSAAGTSSIALSLVHSASGSVEWGPCTIPITVVAPETASTNWTPATSSPLSDGSHFQDGSFISATQGWVIGAPGDVHFTNDGGNSWEHRFDMGPNSAGSFFRSVAFVSDTKGWIGDLGPFATPAPGRSLWETTDGGFTWTNVSARISGATVIGLCGMWPINATTVVGVGRWSGPAVFLKTADAGATWQSQSLAPMLTGAVDVHFFDATHGIIAGGRGVGNSMAEQQASRVVVLATDDGGATWSERFVGSKAGAWSWKISFPTPQIGYIATQGPSSGPTVLKTFDGGATWREIEILGGPSAGLWGAGFSSTLVGWVGADNGVWQTRDGGLTWTTTMWGTDGSINRFRMFPNGTAFAMGKQVYRLTP
jgi:photosystem II stability/assembly factor-like uncharacterized protein